MEGKYIDEELTYVLIGAGYTVYNRLKFGYQEKYYQRGYEQELKTQKKKFKKRVQSCYYL